MVAMVYFTTSPSLRVSNIVSTF